MLGIDFLVRQQVSSINAAARSFWFSYAVAGQAMNI